MSKILQILWKKSILIFIFKGSSITNGLCACALTIENGDYTIWYYGHPYKVNEHHNPIKVVSALVNGDDVIILYFISDF